MLIRMKEMYRPVFAGDTITFGFQEEAFEMERSPEVDRLIELIAAGNSVSALYEKTEIPREDIDAFLRQLDEFGMVERLDDGADGRVDADRYKTNLKYFSAFSDLQTSSFEYQRRLQDATVFLIGVGGSILTALCLVGMGVGKLILLDCDKVERSNLSRQFIYTEKDIGRWKTEAAKEALGRINPGVRIETVNMRVENAACLDPYVQRADVVINAIDTPPILASRWVSYACMRRDVPLVQGGIAPEAVVLDRYSRTTGCYDCYLLAAARSAPGFKEQLLAVTQNEDDTLDFNTSYAPNVALLAWALATEAGKLAAGYAPPLVERASLRIHVNTLDKKWINDHSKQPACPSCSGLRKEAEPVSIEELLGGG